MSVHGVDVASYQPTDYSTTGLDFVFVKATEGTNYVNPKQAAQTARGRAAGLVLGFYHFQRDGSPEAQAKFFVEKCASLPGDILACDWEDGAVSCAEKDRFIREVKRLRPDHRVVLYCNLSFWKSRDTTSYCGDGLWIADPSAPAGHPRVQHPWLFHQYSISGGMDRNVGAFKDRAALRAWAGGATPTPSKEDDMALTKADVKTLWLTDGVVGVPADWSPGNNEWMPASILIDIGKRVRSMHTKLDAQSTAITELAKALASRDAAIDPDALVARITAAIESVTVHLDVPEGA